MAPLTGLIIAAAGDFGRGKGVEQLSKWVVRNGGRWASRIAKGITHLICSKEAYKKNVDAGTSIESLIITLCGGQLENSGHRSSF